MTKKRQSARASLRDLPDVITPEQLAAVTGQHPNVVRRQCADGVIPAKKIGTHWYMSRDAVLGPLVAEPPVLDERAAGKIVDAIKEMLAAGKTLTLEIKEA